MKTSVSIVLMLLASLQNLAGQWSYPGLPGSKMICLPDTEFVSPEIGKRAGLEPSFLAIFDVIGLSPQNVQISGLDSSSVRAIELFKPSIDANLNRLTYIKDTTNFPLRVFYRTRARASLSHGYAELITEGELLIVARQSHIQRSGPHWTVKEKPEADTAFAYSQVVYKSGPVAPGRWSAK